MDAKTFYGESYKRASDYSEGSGSPALDAAYRYFGMAMRNEGEDNKFNMALNAALKNEKTAFPG